MENQLTLKGTIKLIGETERVSDSFSKREIVITTDDRYPQDVKFEFVNDNTSKLDSVGVGQEVSIAFDIRGNEWKGRHYVNLTGWKLEAGEGWNQEEQASNVTVLDDDEEIPF